MGGDFMPKNPVKGALEALSLRDDIQIVLVGRSEQLMRLGNNWAEHDRLSCVDASEIITMEDSPVEAYRKKKEFLHSCGVAVVKR